MTRPGSPVIALLGALLFACVPSAPLTRANVQRSVLAPLLVSEGSTLSPMGETTLFGTHGYVYVLTVLTADGKALSEKHTRHYRWYANGELLKSSKPVRFRMPSSPHTLWSWEPTIAFGEGDHAVELILDGERVDRLEFRVSKKVRPAAIGR